MTGTLSVAADGTTTQTVGDGADYGNSGGSHRKGHRYEMVLFHSFTFQLKVLDANQKFN